MNVDLLLTLHGDAGLVCDTSFKSPVANVMLDVLAGIMSFEFADHDALELNIPVDQDYLGTLYYAEYLHLGIIEGGRIQEGRQIPIIHFNDPEEMPDSGLRPPKMGNSVLAFEHFMKNTNMGQPVHRADLGNENSLDGVMSGLNTAVLQFAPQLARQKSMEAAPKAAPQGPAGPSGPGGMGGGGGGYRGGGGGHQTPPTKRDDDDKRG